MTLAPINFLLRCCCRLLQHLMAGGPKIAGGNSMNKTSSNPSRFEHEACEEIVRRFLGHFRTERPRKTFCAYAYSSFTPVRIFLLFFSVATIHTPFPPNTHTTHFVYICRIPRRYNQAPLSIRPRFLQYFPTAREKVNRPLQSHRFPRKRRRRQRNIPDLSHGSLLELLPYIPAYLH